jgi:hypothetical protein
MTRFNWPALIGAALLVACTDDAPLEPNRQATTSATVTVSGQLTDAATGASICAAMPAPVPSAYVQIWQLSGSTWTFLAQGYAGCDTDAQFSIDVPAGDNYYLLGEFYAGSHEPYPNRWIDRRPFNARRSRVRDARIAQGRALAGGAFLNRVPLPGAHLALLVEDGVAPREIYPWWYGGYFEAGATGAWSWWQAGAPLLQRGLKYTATCGDQLGTMLLTAPVTFTFPADASSIRCNYANSPFGRTSHTATRMTVSMFPGMFGSNQDDKSDGLGWGAQFKTSAAAAPSHNPYSSIARDVRFAFTVNDQIVITGSGGMVGLIEHSHFLPVGSARSSLNGAGRRVVYELADPVSGLGMTQVSYDGAGGDYVLIQLVLMNNTASPMVLHGGIAADWAVAANMDGRSALGGRLGWASDAWSNFKYIGSVILGAEYAPRVLVDKWGLRDVNVQADGVKALQGFYTNTADDDAFFLMSHTVGPITLNAGARRQLWMAIVGGTSEAEIEANAAAAAVEYTARTGKASGM